MFQVPFCTVFSLASGGVVTRLIQNRGIGFHEPAVPRIHLDDEPGQVNYDHTVYIGVEGFQGVAGELSSSRL